MLKKDIRDTVIEHIERDIVTDVTSEQRGMEWFFEKFNFINDDNSLKKHLAEAFYQARFMEKTRGTLRLKGVANDGFIKIQIILYASIYEALIDYALEKNKSNSFVENILRKKDYAVVSALSILTTLSYKDDSDSPSYKVYTCKERVRNQNLKEIQFKDRLEAAISINFVQSTQKDEIELLYKSRNQVHLTTAAKNDFKPNSAHSSKAYGSLFSFLNHANLFFNPVTE